MIKNWSKVILGISFGALHSGLYAMNGDVSKVVSDEQERNDSLSGIRRTLLLNFGAGQHAKKTALAIDSERAGFKDLHRAVKEGDSKDVAEILEKITTVTGDSVNDFTYDPLSGLSLTALHLAALYDRTDLLDLLVIRGDATVDARDSEGLTPLHCAAEFASYEFVVLFVDLLRMRAQERQARMIAQQGPQDKDFLKEMVNSLHTKKGSPLHCACASKKDDREKVAQVLLDAGALPNAVTNKGLTPLMQAVRSRNYELVAMLTLYPEVKRFLHLVKAGGMTALEWAQSTNVNHVNDAIIGLLQGTQVARASGAKNATRSSGAVSFSSSTGMRVGTFEGSNPGSARASPRQNGEGSRADLRKSYGSRGPSAPGTPRETTATTPRSNPMSPRVSDGLSVSPRTGSPRAAIQDIPPSPAAVLRLRRGAGLSQNAPQNASEQKISDLEKCVLDGLGAVKSYVAEALPLDAKAIDGVDELGNTLLFYAIVHKKDDIVKLLIEMGAAFDKSNKEGKTPLMKAAEMRYYEALVFMLSRSDASKAERRRMVDAFPEPERSFLTALIKQGW